MIYLVHTIKELKNNTINTDFVIEAENENDIKSLMSMYKVIVLGVTTVSWRPTSWKFFWIFQNNNGQQFKFCIKAETIESACNHCVELDLPIININDITNPISEIESQNLINSLINNKQKKIQEAKAIEEVAKKKNKEIIDDKRKEKIMTVIWETLHDIDIMEKNEKIITQISVNEKRKLHDLKELLTKIKMWSNIEKATTVLEETFKLMEQIETANLSQMKEEEQKIMSASVVSNIDIISELEKLRRANQWEQAWTKKSSSDLYYTYLWIVWLYQKFILKDIFHNLLEFKKILTYSIEYIWFWLVCLSTFIWILFGYNYINEQISQNILLFILYVWILWIMREIPLAFKQNSFLINIICIILAIIISIIIQKLLITNFALV